MRKPNFFIAGAPRCGTTALYQYVSTHPNIFLSNPKETYYWATDLPGHRKMTELEEYLSLFSQAGEQHLAVGEATPLYLYSKTALPLIKDFAPDAKIALMLRNPIDQIRSHHALRFFNGTEDVEDFEMAWQLQDARARGERIPPRCVDPPLLQYGATAKYGEQMERLLKFFPREQVLVVLTEDFSHAPREAYQ